MTLRSRTCKRSLQVQTLDIKMKSRATLLAGFDETWKQPATAVNFAGDMAIPRYSRCMPVTSIASLTDVGSLPADVTSRDVGL